MAGAEQASLDVERIALDDRGAVMGLVTFTRTDEMNPLDWATVKELRRVSEDLAADDAVRVIAITGRGRAFSAGGDMKKYQQLQRDPVDFPQFLQDFHDLVEAFAFLPKPTLALVNGIAVAGGIELLLGCDLAFAAESARIGDAHQTFGQMGGGGVLSLLTHAVGPARARELLFSGRMMPAHEALDWGLVSRVVPDEELLEAGIAFARDVAKKSPLAIANAKRVANTALWEGVAIRAGLRLEREATARYCLTSEDAHHGLDAFANKQQPQFTGR